LGLGGQRHARPLYPRGKSRYLLYRRLGGPQGRSKRVRKISPPPGFDPRTVQRIANRYTDWANIASTYNMKTAKYLLKAKSRLAVVNSCFACKDIWDMKLTTHLHVVPTLSISGATCLLPATCLHGMDRTHLKK